MTLREAYHYGRELLKKAEINDADLDAWYLLEFVANISKSYYYVNENEILEDEKLAIYQKLLEKRADHTPLQYLTGVQEFMGLTFEVNEHVLIPRQDTEILVEEVLKTLRPGMSILDMCTGSGCILISLLSICAGTQGIGVDISEDALQVAEANGKTHRVAADFVESNLFERVTGVFDVIVSNPPYIATTVVDGLMKEVKDHEPRIALDGKEDGLYFYRRITAESKAHLKNGGSLFFEIGFDQGEAVSELLREQGFYDIKVVKDLAGLDRVVCGKCR